MTAVVLVVHLIIAVGLIGVILMQRSEGGSFGENAVGGLFSARGRGDVLTRTTAILATMFFITSIGLSILAGQQRASSPTSIIDRMVDQPASSAPAAPATPAAPPADVPQVPQPK